MKSRGRREELTSILAGDEIDVFSELGLVVGMAHEILQTKSLDDACRRGRNPRTRRGVIIFHRPSPLHSANAGDGER